MPTTQVTPFDAPTIARQISDLGALAALREIQEAAPANSIQLDGFVIHLMTHSETESFRNSVATIKVGDPGKELATMVADATNEVSRLFNERTVRNHAAMITAGSEEACCVVAFDKLQHGHDLYVGVSCANPYLNRPFAMALCEGTGCKTPSYDSNLLEAARQAFRKHGVMSGK